MVKFVDLSRTDSQSAERRAPFCSRHGSAMFYSYSIVLGMGVGRAGGGVLPRRRLAASEGYGHQPGWPLGAHSHCLRCSIQPLPLPLPLPLPEPEPEPEREP